MDETATFDQASYEAAKAIPKPTPYKGCDHTPKEIFIHGATRLICDCGRWQGDVLPK